MPWWIFKSIYTIGGYIKILTALVDYIYLHTQSMSYILTKYFTFAQYSQQIERRIEISLESVG